MCWLVNCTLLSQLLRLWIWLRSPSPQKAVQEVKECLATGVVPEGLTAPPPEPQGEDGKVGRKRQVCFSLIIITDFFCGC